jgi:hypothetical protein
MLAPGGIYFIDDLLPQLNWPEGHQESVGLLVSQLEARDDLLSSSVNWATGIMICVKKA